uniref:Uncharacterized protein n=1 Tax=Arundo donax TaxID=35708 RepID=A0A0A9E900_ARUDO
MHRTGRHGTPVQQHSYSGLNGNSRGVGWRSLRGRPAVGERERRGAGGSAPLYGMGPLAGSSFGSGRRHGGHGRRTPEPREPM